MFSLWRRFIAINDRFAEWVGQVLSWSIWLPIVLLGTIAWLASDQITHGRFDPGLTTLVLILTIQTSVDSLATKLFQIALRKSDEKRDAQWMQQLASMSALTVQIREELDHSRERETILIAKDDATEARDAIVYKLLSKLVDKIEIHPGAPT